MRLRGKLPGYVTSRCSSVQYRPANFNIMGVSVKSVRVSTSSTPKPLQILKLFIDYATVLSSTSGATWPSPRLGTPKACFVSTPGLKLKVLGLNVWAL